MRDPAKDRRGTVAEMVTLELLSKRAIEKGDAKQLGVIAYAWCLLGWSPNSFTDFSYGLTSSTMHEMVDAGQARRAVKVLRAEARGLIMVLDLLASSVFRESWATAFGHDSLMTDPDSLRLIASRYLPDVGWSYRDVDDGSWWEPARP